MAFKREVGNQKVKRKKDNALGLRNSLKKSKEESRGEMKTKTRWIAVGVARISMSDLSEVALNDLDN